MDGFYDDNFYFNNPIDYVGGMTDPGLIGQRQQRDLHIATGTGPWEHPAHSYGLSRAAAASGDPRITSTTGARSAGTTGRTGST